MATPIFMIGDKDRPANYRPISLSYICSKLLEHIITNSILSQQFPTVPSIICSMVFQIKGTARESQLIEFASDIVTAFLTTGFFTNWRVMVLQATH